MKNSNCSNEEVVPFFIIGAQRSGTTMLRLMLNAHPRLFVPFESGFIPSVYAVISMFGDLSKKENRLRLIERIANHPLAKKGGLITEREELLSDRSISTYAELVNRIFAINAQSAGKRRWGDKTPGYVTEIDTLRKIFPNCKIIHLIRDGRDVVLSLRKLKWGSKNLLHAAADWRWKTMLGRKMGNMIGCDYHELKYEDLVLESKGELMKICAFLGERFYKSMLFYSETAIHEMPAQSLEFHQSSVKPPNLAKVLAWKHKMNIPDRALFEQIAGVALKLFDYELENHPPSLLSKLNKLRYVANLSL